MDLPPDVEGSCEYTGKAITDIFPPACEFRQEVNDSAQGNQVVM